jgi:methyltransferase (TIGR00027 family)
MTALVVAAWRAIETDKGEGALITDPWAATLVGTKMVQQIKDSFSEADLTGWVDFMATRTKHIDDWLAAQAPLQLVILGAGLDTRAYRLAALRNTRVFEVDFGTVLEAKRSLLNGAETVARSCVHVPANLATDPWDSLLRDAGFDKTMPACWLLEGLTGYLSEAELRSFLRRVAGMAAEGSSLMATFMGEGEQKAGRATAMHRFFLQRASEAGELLAEVGWRADPPETLKNVAARYGRSVDRETYYLVQASRGAVKSRL